MTIYNKKKTMSIKEMRGMPYPSVKKTRRKKTILFQSIKSQHEIMLINYYQISEDICIDTQ